MYPMLPQNVEKFQSQTNLSKSTATDITRCVI